MISPYFIASLGAALDVIGKAMITFQKFVSEV